MVVRTAPQRPVIFALALRHRQIVDAGDSQPHEAALVELPVFIAVAAKPMAAVVVPLIGKPHGYPVLAKSPNFLDEPVVEFARPLSREKCLDVVAALQEVVVIALTAVGGIRKRDPCGVSTVPRVFRHVRLLSSGFRS